MNTKRRIKSLDGRSKMVVQVEESGKELLKFLESRKLVSYVELSIDENDVVWLTVFYEENTLI